MLSISAHLETSLPLLVVDGSQDERWASGGGVSGEGWKNIKKRCKGEDEVERLCVLYIYTEAHIYSRHVRPRGIYPESAPSTIIVFPECRGERVRAPALEVRREQIGSGPAANLLRRGAPPIAESRTMSERLASDKMPDDDEKHSRGTTLCTFLTETTRDFFFARGTLLLHPSVDAYLIKSDDLFTTKFIYETRLREYAKIIYFTW